MSNSQFKRISTKWAKKLRPLREIGLASTTLPADVYDIIKTGLKEVPSGEWQGWSVDNQRLKYGSMALRRGLG